MWGAILTYLASKAVADNAMDKANDKKRALNKTRMDRLSAIGRKRRGALTGDVIKNFSAEERARNEAAAAAPVQQAATAALQESLASAEGGNYAGTASTGRDIRRATLLSDALEKGSEEAAILARLSGADINNARTAADLNLTGARGNVERNRARYVNRDFQNRIDAVQPDSLQMILAELGQTYAMGQMMGGTAGEAAEDAYSGAQFNPVTGLEWGLDGMPINRPLPISNRGAFS